ncbi:MAG TPA: PspC domain-containing protein [Actinopolymorphaceae bacterium]
MSPDVPDLLSDLRRLRRSGEDRVLAGVCGGIGRGLRVDPVLLRVTIVVLAFFGGVGILLYLVGWVLVPQENSDQSALEEQLGTRRDGSPDKPIYVAGVVVVLIMLATMPWWGLSWHGPALFVLFVVGFVALVRHRGGPVDPSSPDADRPGSPTVGLPDSGVITPAEGDATGPRDTMTGTERTAPAPEEYPPDSWRRFGPAPASFWERPDPLGLEAEEPTPTVGDESPLVPAPTAHLPAERRRPRLFLATSGALAVVLGVMSLVEGGAGIDFPPSAYLAAALGVVGLGLVVGTWLGRSRGLIALGVVLALLLPCFAFAERLDLEASTDRIVPRTVEEIAPKYDVGFGDIRLDLSRVRFDDTTTVRTTVDLGAGGLRVVVPPDVDVVLDADIGIGDLRAFGRRYSEGFDVSRQVRNTGRDGPGGGTLHLRADIGAGDMVVQRG